MSCWGWVSQFRRRAGGAFTTSFHHHHRNTIWWFLIFVNCSQWGLIRPHYERHRREGEKKRHHRQRWKGIKKIMTSVLSLTVVVACLPAWWWWCLIIIIIIIWTSCVEILQYVSPGWPSWKRKKHSINNMLTSTNLHYIYMIASLMK